LRQQRQAIDTHRFVIGIHHNVIEEVIHRFAQLRQLNQSILIAAFRKVRLQFVA